MAPRMCTGITAGTSQGVAEAAPQYCYNKTFIV